MTETKRRVRCLQCGHYFDTTVECPRCPNCKTRDIDFNRIERMTNQYLMDELVRRGYGIAVRSLREEYFRIQYCPSDFPLNYLRSGITITTPTGAIFK